jgi:hypothetical protein
MQVKALSTPDPRKNAEALAVNAINAISASTFGGIAGPVVSSDILGLFGIGGASDKGGYLKQIESKLDKISGQLTELQNAVDSLTTTTDAILQDVTELQSELKQDTLDIELQSALQVFGNERIIIGENFRTYANAVQAIAGNDFRVKAAQDLFEIFSTINLQQIAISMQKMQALFDPGLVAVKSIPQLLLARAEVTMDIAVRSATSPFNIFSGVGGALPDGAAVIKQLNALHQGGPIAAAVTGVADTHCKQAASIFRAFLAVQVQALALLTTAWIRTEQASQIQQLVGALGACLSTLSKFCSDFTGGNSSWPGFDQYLKKQVLAIAGRIGPPASQKTWRTFDGHNRNWVDGPFPLNGDWIAWNVTPRGDMQMLFNPWGADGSFGNGVQTPLPAGKPGVVTLTGHLEHDGSVCEPVFFIPWNDGTDNLGFLGMKDVWRPKFDFTDELSFVPVLTASFPRSPH